MQVKFSNIGVEPVSLVDVKSYMKVDFNDENDLITSLITGAREAIEEFTGLALVTKTVEAFYTNDEVVEMEREIELPFPAHNEITEVKVNDVVTTDYTKTGLTRFIVNIPFVSSSLSSSGIDNEGVKITYTTSGDCPEAIKTEIKRMILQQYEQRGNTFEGAIVELSENAYANLLKFCVI